MSLKQKTISGIFWTSVQQFGIVGIRLIVQIFLARIIAPEEFGLFGLILIFNALGKTLADSGMGQSLIRSNKLTEKDYGSVFILNLSISLLAYGILYFVAPYVAGWYEKPMLTQLIRIYGIAIILNAFSTIQIHRLTKLMKFKEQTMIQLPSVLISSVVGLVLAYLNYGVYALVWMEVAFAALLALQFWLLTKWRPQIIFDIHSFQYHFHFGYKLLLSGLLATIMNNIYPMVIGKFSPLQQVGFFTRATSMMIIPVGSIMAVLGKVSYPVLAEVQNDEARLKRMFKALLKMAMFVIAPIMILLILIAEPLFVFLITDVWLPAVPYFQLLCLAGMIYPLHVYNLNVLKVRGRSDLFLKSELYKNFIGILILIATAPFGIIPMIYGILVASVLSLFINQYFSSQVFHYPYWEQNWDCMKVTWPAFLLGALLFYLNSYIQYAASSVNHLIHICVLSFLFLISYFVLQKLINPAIMNEIKETLKQLKKKKTSTEAASDSKK